MILADKIINLRKKMLWSQEELADKLDVSRQSVSKWESSQSIPDMDKILKMSRLFGVSTDYLLKDELGETDEQPQVQDDDNPALRHVSMEQASEYMEIRAKNAPRLALSTLLCVLAPMMLLLFIALSLSGWIKLTEDGAAGIGLSFMIIFVAIGVIGFIKASSESSEYEFLEKEAFETEYGVSGAVKKRKDDYKEQYTRINTICTVMCILSVVPLFLSICFNAADFVFVLDVCFILLMTAIACYGFVYAGTIMGSYNKLLEEGDYTRREKSRSSVMGSFSTIYWLTVTAIFLVFQLAIPGTWTNAWVIWPIAGVLFAVFRIIVALITRNK